MTMTDAEYLRARIKADTLRLTLIEDAALVRSLYPDSAHALLERLFNYIGHTSDEDSHKCWPGADARCERCDSIAVKVSDKFRDYISDVEQFLTRCMAANKLHDLQPSSSKPQCCDFSCTSDAEYEIRPVPAANFEDATEACAKHIGDLLGTTGKQEVGHYVVCPL